MMSVKTPTAFLAFALTVYCSGAEFYSSTDAVDQGRAKNSAAPTTTVTGSVTLDVFVANASSYALSSTPVPGAPLMVWLNGLLMAQGIDYSLTNGVVTFTGQVVLSDAAPIVQAMYWTTPPPALPPANPTISLIASTSAGGSSFWSTATTADIDTTKATLVVAITADVTCTGWGLSDLMGNTWIEGAQYSTQSACIAVWYAWQGPNNGPLATGPGEVVNFYGHLPSVALLAFSGTGPVSDPLRQEVGGAGGLDYGQSPIAGSIAPTAGGWLIVSAVASWQATAFSIDSGLTIPTNASMPFSEASPTYSEAVAAAYTVQATAATIDPTWTLIESGYGVAVAAAFR